MVDGVRPGATLALDRLTVDREVARRLPFALACRYRALPVAEGNGQLTVAMADPDDPEACRAIEAALGLPVCLVRSDALVIEALLAEVWPGETGRRLQVAVYLPGDPRADDLERYARAIGGLLQAEVQRAAYPRRGAKEGPGEEPGTGADRAGCDLAILPIKEGLADWPGPGCSRAALLVGQPRWPVRQVLFVLDGGPLNEEGLGWAVRLALPSRATITLLAVVPPAPGRGPTPPERPGRQRRAENRLDAWLSGDTAASRQIRRASGLLADAAIPGRLRLRQGPTDREIAQEMASAAYDLAVVAGRMVRGGNGPDGQDTLRDVGQRAGCPILLT